MPQQPPTIPIDPTEVLTLTQELIRIESHSDAPGREAQIGYFLVDWFRERGIEAVRQPVVDDRANVISRLPGGNGPSLMLCGHLDTIPPGLMKDAFNPTVDGSGPNAMLHGRGACDMKGAVAAMACTLVSMKESGLSLNGDLVFAGTIDEETGALGVKHLIDEGIVTNYAIVGEPTALRVGIAHKGAHFIRVSVHGRGAHGSCPEKGINAVAYASRIAVALEEKLRSQLAKRTSPLLGTSTVSVGRISGGIKPNIVAETCELDIDRRTLPGEANPVEDVRTLVSEICDEVEDLTYSVSEMPATAVVPHSPLVTSSEAILAKAVTQACRDLSLDDQPIGLTYWTDGGVLAAAGIESVILGPGDIALAHGPKEAVPVGELGKATQLYANVTLHLLS